MSLSVAILIFLGLNLVVLLFQGLALWAGGRFMRLTEARLARAVCLCVAIGVLCLVLNAAAAIGSVTLEERALGDPAHFAPWLASGLTQIVFLVQLLLAWVVIKWFLPTEWSPAVLLALLVILAGYFANYPANYLRSRYFDAFRISSDFMAPAIGGAQARVTCSGCGRVYAVNMAERLHPGRRGSSGGKASVCSNCGQSDTLDATAPVCIGDRVVVEKTAAPMRWDAVLFNYQPTGEGTVTALAARPVSLVQRLVGLPGETLELVGGDVFIAGKRLSKGPVAAPEMWIGLHDTRFSSPEHSKSSPRWQPSEAHSRWESTDRGWSIRGDQVESDRLVYRGPIADGLDYNDLEGRWSAEESAAPRLGDVRLDCSIAQFAGSGVLAFEWEFAGQSVRATLNARGEVQLAAGEGTGAEGSRQPGKSARGNLVGGLYADEEVGFLVRDGEAYLTQRQAVVASVPIGSPDIAGAKARLSRVAGHPCRISIVAQRCTTTLRRLVLYRDVYYRSIEEMSGPRSAGGWGCTNQPILLAADKYFFLGDNSVRSKDSRFLGAIDAGSVVGVVRWVFWPPAHWHEFR